MRELIHEFFKIYNIRFWWLCLVLSFPLIYATLGTIAVKFGEYKQNKKENNNDNK